MNLQILANIFCLFVTFAFFPCRATSRAQDDKELNNKVKAVQKKMSNFMDNKESTYESDQQSVATTKFSDHSSWEIDPFCPARASSKTKAPSPVLPTWASQEAIIRKQARRSRKKDIDNDTPTKTRPLIEEKKSSSKQQQHSRKGSSSRELRIYEEQQQHEGRRSSSEIVPFDTLSNPLLDKKKKSHRHHDEKRDRHHDEKLARKKSTSKKPPKPNSYWATTDFHQLNEEEDDLRMVTLRESSSLEWPTAKEARAQRSSKHRYDGAETSKREYLRDEHKRQSNNGLTVYEKKRHDKSSTKNRASREHRTRKSSKAHDEYGGYEDHGYDEMARSSSGITNMQKLPRQRRVTTSRTMVLTAQSPRQRSVSRSRTMQYQRESTGRRRQNGKPIYIDNVDNREFDTALDKQIVASFPLTIKQREVPNHEELKNFSQELLKRNSPAKENEEARRVILNVIEEKQEEIKKNPELGGDVRDLSNPREQDKAIKEYLIGVANNCETKIMPEEANNIRRFVSQVKSKPRSISKFFNIKSMPPPRSRPNQYDWNGYEEFGYEAEHEAQPSQFLTLTRDNYNNGSALAGDSAVVGLRQNSTPSACTVNNEMPPQFDDVHHYYDANYAPSYDSDENSAPGTPKQLEWKENLFDSEHYAS